VENFNKKELFERRKARFRARKSKFLNMRKIAALFLLGALISFTDVRDPLSEKERKFAKDFLAETRARVVDVTKNLTPQQLAYKPAPDRWSVEECMKHIAVTEMGLWKMADSVIESPANPEKRSEVKVTDEKIIEMISDRSKKVKTQEAMEPQNTPYKSNAEALQSFEENRQKLIDYVGRTDRDLRNHVVQFPFGYMDTYQMILFIGAHTRRHTLQMEEVIADPGFPRGK
jgi:hypothetical protein